MPAPASAEMAPGFQPDRASATEVRHFLCHLAQLAVGGLAVMAARASPMHPVASPTARQPSRLILAAGVEETVKVQVARVVAPCGCRSKAHWIWREPSV